MIHIIDKSSGSEFFDCVNGTHYLTNQRGDNCPVCGERLYRLTKDDFNRRLKPFGYSVGCYPRGNVWAYRLIDAPDFMGIPLTGYHSPLDMHLIICDLHSGTNIKDMPLDRFCGEIFPEYKQQLIERFLPGGLS